MSACNLIDGFQRNYTKLDKDLSLSLSLYRYIYIYQSVIVVCQENLTAVNYLTHTQTPSVKTEIRWKGECQRLRRKITEHNDNEILISWLYAIVKPGLKRKKEGKEKEYSTGFNSAWDQYVSDLLSSRPEVALI